MEAPQAQSVSNLKGVFGFEKKAADGAPKVGVPPPKTSGDASWIKKEKPAEDVKPPVTAPSAPSSGVKPQVNAPPPSNPWKKADPPVQTVPVAPPKPAEPPKVVEQPKPSPFQKSNNGEITSTKKPEEPVKAPEVVKKEEPNP